MNKTSAPAEAAEDSPIDAIKARVTDLSDQAKESGSDAIERVRELVENHPFESLGTAFAVGYVLKMLTGPLVTTALLGGGAYLLLRPQATAPRKRAAKSK